jgi:hypothetical protein
MKPVHMKTAMITQQELEDFAALRGQLDVLKRRVGEERERLIRLVEADAPVEPGRFEVTVDEFVQRRVTKAILVGLLGADEYEALRQEVEPTVCLRLFVREGARGGISFEWGEEQARGWPPFAREDRP